MLSNSRFYYGITKKAIIAFGSLFNNLYIQRVSAATNTIEQSINVPLSYSPKNKWLASILFNPEKEDRQFAMQLPRMAFEITNYEYAPQRKLQTNLVANKYVVNPLATGSDASSGVTPDVANKATSVFPPAPYKLTFKLYIITKNQEDMMQIVEQIIPYFNPMHSVRVKWVPELNVVKDFPITLEEIQTSDTYEGKLDVQREILWTFTFSANIDYFGASSHANVIKKVDVDFNASLDDNSDPDIRYHVEVNPLTANMNDNYAFLESWSA